MKHPLTINSEKCTGCAGCVAVCPFGALSMQGGVAVVDLELCCGCGACVEICMCSAISLAAQTKEPASDLSEFQGVWVFAQQSCGVLHDSSFELLAAGRNLADTRGCYLAAVVMGRGVAENPALLIAAGADRVYSVDDPLLQEYEASLYADAMAQLIERYKPEIVLAAATAVGRGFFARTAVRTQTGLTADCTSLSIDPENGNLIQTRPAFGGNIMARIVTPYHRPQMATVRPHVFQRGRVDPDRSGEVLVESVALVPPLTHILKSISGGEGVGLAASEIIVAGGRGVKGRKNFDLLFQLAEKLGGVVGASRACVDAGWISAAHQVGQTGRTVAPKVYLAFGISGAVQHLVGMRSSTQIIAVNSDPHAPILNIADIAVVGDLFEIIPELVQAL